MRKLNYPYETKPILDVIESCGSDETKQKLKDYVSNHVNQGYSVQIITKNIREISSNNSEENLVSALDRYIHSNSRKEKLEIKKGGDAVSEFTEKLANRPRPSVPFSILTREYWISRGYTEEEAKEFISAYQSSNGKKAMENYRNSGKDVAKELKFSLKYWTSRGFSTEEASELREPYLSSMRNDLESMIKRHGEETGTLLYNERIEKYKKTCKENLHHKEKAGYVSKESLKNILIPLYKECRKLGIPRKEIYLGVSGSREFFIRHPGHKNTGRFFDFCLPHLGIVIEYNGTFWHPSESREWKNPWLDYDKCMSLEHERDNLCKNRGYDLIIVWSDEDMAKALNNIMTFVRERYNEQNST